MPGIIYHLSFAEEVYRNMYSKEKINKVEFFSGNLIPDLAEDKQKTHYRISASFKGFTVPDIKLVKKELYNKNNSINLGMYCHLYLDYYFIETFLIPEFHWDVTKNLVINPRTGKSWGVKEFFAKPCDRGILYNGYTQINKMMIEDGHIDMKTIDMLPDDLPLTGSSIFDKRRELSWRDELNKYFAEDAKYTGEPFDYYRLWSAIERIAKKFVKEELKI